MMSTVGLITVYSILKAVATRNVNLSHEKEPQIFDAITFGSVLENVIINDQTRIADYNDTTLTENTRAAYPMHAIDNIVLPSVAGHPNTIIFLTADASAYCLQSVSYQKSKLCIIS